MPVYNGEKYLEEAIQSILRQTLNDFELLIIDDGSNDRSSEIVQAYDDQRIRLICNKKNLGVAASLNKAIRVAQGKYIARMDADDIALENRLQLQVDFLEEANDISIVGAAVQCFGEKSYQFNYPRTHQECITDLLCKPCFAHPVVMWHKQDFIDFDLWYQEEPPTAEDYDLWERASHYIKMANLPDILLRYRIDPQVKVSSYLQQQNKGHYEIKKRLLIRLGIQVDDETLHSFVGFTGGPFQKKSSLSALFKITQKVWEANLSRRLYSDRFLLNVLKDRLYVVSLHSNESISEKIRLWSKVELPFNKFVRFKYSTKLIAKSFL